MNNSINHGSLVSVVIPAYNEEKSVMDVIMRIPNHQNYEIIVVNDGSTDSTLRVLKNVKRKIKIINHEQNQGYGASIISGIKNSSGNIIVTIDSDGQHFPEDIPELIQPILNKKADIVVGSRYLGKCYYKVPMYTRLGEFCISLCLWLFFRQKVGNNQSGFRAFNRRSLAMFDRIYSNKFGLCTEILFRGAFLGMKIVEVPINLNPREYGKSYVRIIKILKPIFALIFLYGLKQFRLRKIIPNFILNKFYLTLLQILKKV